MGLNNPQRKYLMIFDVDGVLQPNHDNLTLSNAQKRYPDFDEAIKKIAIIQESPKFIKTPLLTARVSEDLPIGIKEKIDLYGSSQS